MDHAQVKAPAEEENKELQRYSNFEYEPLLVWGKEILYTVKKGTDFPVPSRDVTDQTLPRQE
jgi:hypothetical protein